MDAQDDPSATQQIDLRRRVKSALQQGVGVHHCAWRVAASDSIGEGATSAFAWCAEICLRRSEEKLCLFSVRLNLYTDGFSLETSQSVVFGCEDFGVDGRAEKWLQDTIEAHPKVTEARLTIVSWQDLADHLQL